MAGFLPGRLRLNDRSKEMRRNDGNRVAAGCCDLSAHCLSGIAARGPGSATHHFMLHGARGDSMHIHRGGPGRKRKKAAGTQRLFSFRVFLVLEARQA